MTRDGGEGVGWSFMDVCVKWIFLWEMNGSKEGSQRVRMWGQMTENGAKYSLKQDIWKKREDGEEILGGSSGSKKTVGRDRRRVEYQNMSTGGSRGRRGEYERR